MQAITPRIYMTESDFQGLTNDGGAPPSVPGPPR